MEMREPPTGAEVLAHLGWPGDQDEGQLLAQADQHASQIALIARSYTRGRGWRLDEYQTLTCAEDIAAVIVNATARSLSNPEQSRRVEAGSFSSLPGNAGSWSLLEALALNAYRRRAG